MQMSLQEGPLPIWSRTLDPELRAEAPEMDPAILLGPWGPWGFSTMGKAQVWDPQLLRTALGSSHAFLPPLAPPFLLHPKKLALLVLQV